MKKSKGLAQKSPSKLESRDFLKLRIVNNINNSVTTFKNNDFPSRMHALDGIIKFTANVEDSPYYVVITTNIRKRRVKKCQ